MGFGLLRSHTKLLVIQETSSTAATALIMSSFTNRHRASRMAQRVKVLGAEPIGDLSSIPGIHMVQRELTPESFCLSSTYML